MAQHLPPLLRSLLPPTEIITFMVSTDTLLDTARRHLALTLKSQPSSSSASSPGPPTFRDLAEGILHSKGYAAVSGARVSVVIRGRQTLLRPAAESGPFDQVMALLSIEDETSLMTVSELRVTLPLEFTQRPADHIGAH